MMLGYSKSRNAIAMHVDEEDKRAEQIVHPFVESQRMTVINEFGLYSLILSSKLPEAKDFKRWVASEVLGYAKPLNAVAMHVEIEDSLKQGLLDSNGKTQQTIFINESGLYALILYSKLPRAREFKRWVTIRGAWADKEDGRLHSDKWLRIGSMVL